MSQTTIPQPVERSTPALELRTVHMEQQGMTLLRTDGISKSLTLVAKSFSGGPGH
jgi:hypothetical protein